jgi:hypothetical protein
MIDRLLRALAAMIVACAAMILPGASRGWGRAMRQEVRDIPQGVEALRFALGCLIGASREVFGPADLHESVQEGRPSGSPTGIGLRVLLVACAIVAVLLGLGHMKAGGAPATMMLMNLIALALGLLLLSTTSMLRSFLPAPDPRSLSLLLSLLLVATALAGMTVDGATRWIRLSGLAVQPSLILLPLILLWFVRRASPASLLAVLLSALALALQPDRAMAGALAAGLLALALTRPDRVTLFALAAAVAGFVATLAQPDVQPAMPFVDQILWTAFALHPLAGVAVVGGAALLVVPGLVLMARGAGDRPLGAAFAATWSAIVLAAALGNYPTPLVGYGGSAILGYLACLWGLPRSMTRAGRPVKGVRREKAEEGRQNLRSGIIATQTIA